MMMIHHRSEARPTHLLLGVAQCGAQHRVHRAPRRVQVVRQDLTPTTP
jgi:hypothetical protein